MNNPNLLQRYEIKDLQTDATNIVIVGIMIGKQECRVFTRSKFDGGKDEEERAVWNFTLRDSPSDYINVTFWGSPATLVDLDTISPRGSLMEITNPRVMLRNEQDGSEQYRPVVSSPFQLSVNEGVGSVIKVRDYFIDRFTRLINLPTKPLCCFTSLATVCATNIYEKEFNTDLLVAVRQIDDMRIVNGKQGMKEVRNVVLFDSTHPGIVLTLWRPDYIGCAELWKPRDTILFIADAKVKFDDYSNAATCSLTSKSLITENPEGSEADTLRQYAKSAVLLASPAMDQIIQSFPDAASIQTVMHIRQIYERIDQLIETKSPRIEDRQFTCVLYTCVTGFDLLGLRKIFANRCAVKEDSQLCSNSVCLSNSSIEPMEVLKTFDFFAQLSDRTGTLPVCRISGRYAETILGCTATEFAQMDDDEKFQLQWSFLFEHCEARLVVSIRNETPFISVVFLATTNI